MNFRYGLQITAGIIAGLGILVVASFFAGVIALSATNKDWAVYANLAVPVIAGIAVWSRRQKNPSPFLNGLFIGICLSLLLSTACDVLVSNIRW